MTEHIRHHFCPKCHFEINENLECLVCKKKQERRKKAYMVIVLIFVLLLGGIFMYFYYKQLYDIQNPIKVYEAVCEEGQDMCFKGDMIKTTSINGTYSDFLRTCECQSCVEKETRDPIELNGFNNCKDLVKAENYMRCKEFVCSNKFIIRIDE